MFFLYSLLYTLAFLLMLPLIIMRRDKYASGFRERLGRYADFIQDDRPVLWLHCVSVGEANAARSLVDSLTDRFPDYRLIISTTTKTGQELARDIFKNKVDAVIYFPFDWGFSVRRALDWFRPSIVLLMETEIWPRFIREAKGIGAIVAIVNGRLSERSFSRYSRVRSFVERVLTKVDIALMQSDRDAGRITKLGISPEKVHVTGNLKFDYSSDARDSIVASALRDRFGISDSVPLIVAASTHEPEEEMIIRSFSNIGQDFRLLIAPRHPQRFDDVQRTINDTDLSFARRSDPPGDADKTAKVILLDSIGELRGAYQLADIVFVGGSLIPHGGQSILEPAAAGRPIITGPYTDNFAAAIKEFQSHDALMQLDRPNDQTSLVNELSARFSELLNDPDLRQRLGQNAARAMKANEGATRKTVEFLSEILNQK
jgi:3-deoxy-D-manno-octulosonic-acid transferase